VAAVRQDDLAAREKRHNGGIAIALAKGGLAVVHRRS
jgi:hypothetical protein